MKAAMFWRPALLGAVLGAIGGSMPLHDPAPGRWAIQLALADEAPGTLPAGGSGGASVSVSAHASASVSTSASDQGCVAESTAEASAQAGDRQKSARDHKRIVQAQGPCQAGADARANVGTTPSADPSTNE